MSRLAFYRLAVPSWLNLQRLRLVVWWIWFRRVLRGLLLGRWPWEVVREIQEERRRVRAAFEPMWKEIEDAVLGNSDRGRKG